MQYKKVLFFCYLLLSAVQTMAQEAFYPLDYLNIQGVMVYSMRKAHNGVL